jgi:membrane-associated phospholipid phosphatase
MAYKISKKIFVILLIIGFILIFSTVYIRAHYVIDVIAGIISAPFVYFLAKQMFKKLSLPVPEKS